KTKEQRCARFESNRAIGWPGKCDHRADGIVWVRRRRVLYGRGGATKHDRVIIRANIALLVLSTNAYHKLGAGSASDFVGIAPAQRPRFLTVLLGKSNRIRINWVSISERLE